jgi:hypothetical protein
VDGRDGRDVNWIQEEAGRRDPTGGGGAEPGGLVSGGKAHQASRVEAAAGGLRPKRTSDAKPRGCDVKLGKIGHTHVAYYTNDMYFD